MPNFPGEFEQMVLLSILQLEDSASAIAIRTNLTEKAGREVSRGALYRTLDRMCKKGLVEYRDKVPSSKQRGGLAVRMYMVTTDGVRELRDSRQALMRLWDGVVPIIEESR